MEIAKQLYDVGRLFENVSDLQITKEAFRKIAVVELSYRSFGTDIGQVFNDIRQTALCISTRGKAGEGDFDPDTRRNHPCQIIHVQAALSDRPCHY